MIEVVDGWWQLQAGSHLTDTVIGDMVSVDGDADAAVKARI